jgi:hypothetical protein
MRTSAVVFVAALAALAAAAPSFGEDVPPGYGTFTPSGSAFTSEITNPVGVVKNPTPGTEDQDAYAFQGFPGMVLTATVKPTKGSAYVPALDVVRPGGTLASDEDGLRVTVKGTTLTATMPLDAAGWWQLKVRGAELTRHVVTADEAAASGGADQAGDVKVTFASGAYTIAVKYTGPKLPLLPVVSKSFKTNALIDSKTDTDDYTFQGYSGETLSAVLKALPVPKGVQPLLPAMSLFRPDGTEATDATITTTGGTVTLANLAMNQQGTWRLHVIGLEPTQPPPNPTINTSTTGPYSLSVKLGKVLPPPSLEPDENHQYRFSIPAMGGATIGWTLNFTGAAPTFNSFVDPSGAPVFGVAAATKVAAFTIPADRPIGNYTLTFDAPATAPTGVSFVPKLVLPKPAKARKATLSKDEPFVVVTPADAGVHPSAGGTGTVVAVTTTDRVLDPADPDPTKVGLFIGHTALTSVTYDTNTKQIRGTISASLPFGTYDVVIASSTGQVSVDAGAFQIVDRPHANSIDPIVGTSAGGYDITITGTGFRAGHVGIEIDGALIAPNITSVTDTTVTFTSPPRSPSPVTFGVIDRETQLVGNLPLNSFEYVGTAAISRLVPNITTILGGDLISVKGANFTNTDHVYVETDTSGVYEEMTNTFVDVNTHRFTAPIRAKGPHAVYVTDQFGQPSPPKTRTLTYFQYTNLTADATVLPSGADQWDGVTTAAADYDGDGSDDLFISRVGGATISPTSLTRVLRNDGTGHFTDVTASVMPPVSSGEDWRADRIWVTDINQDGYPDIVIISNDNAALTTSKSHLRILRNEPRGGSGPSAADRVFYDRTVDLFPAPRVSSPLYGGGGATVVDSWRGLDMWIGDVDKGPPGPPEILITHKELKEELDVGCGNYCASPYSSGYTYGFYWGGSRAFVWNPSANFGQGKYKFEHNFFPRKSGVRVPVIAPGGVKIPICNSTYGSPCRGKFTPFTGKRIAVGDLNADGKPDVAVVNDDPVTRDGTTISSLQVGINKFNSAAGSEITDVTDAVGGIQGSFQADAIAIGQTGYPDGNSYGTIAITKAAYGGGAPLMRLIKFKPPTLPGAVADFEEVTTAVLPPNSGSDNMQASRIIFRDIDTDGDQDMILVCDAAPGGTGPAFRIFRNERVGTQVGLLRETLKGLITPLLTSSEHFEGVSLAIGDVNKDGAPDFIITRATTSPTSPAPQTRILITDKSK